LQRPIVLVALVLACAALSACFSSSSGGPGTSVNFDLDSGTDFDATVPDAEPDAGPEAATEAAAADAGVVETSLEDASIPEASAADVEEEGLPEASLPDTSLPDAGIEDASLADVTVPEASILDAAIPDVTIPDASLPDVTIPDASVAEVGVEAGSCITSVFGEHYVAPDGTLYYAPSSSTHVQIIEAANSQPLQPMVEVVQQVNDHACGLRGDGTVWCWSLTAGGGNTDGDLGNGVIGGTVPPVGAATQVVTGPSGDGGASVLTGVVHLSTASDTAYTFPTCAIRSDKTVWCWGYATSGALFQGSTGSSADVPYAIPMAAAASDGGAYPVVTADQVSVGGYFMCVLLSGRVSCWGLNTIGPLADGDMSLATKQYPVPVVTGLGLPATVDAIGCGYNFACALAGGQVWCWGASGDGQAGNPSVPAQICNLNYCQPAPVPVQASLPDGGESQVDGGGTDQDPLSSITSIVVGYQFACALDASGNIWCWGAKYAGSQFWFEATPFTSALVPTTNVTRLTALGEDTTGLIYTTASGVYVNGNQEITPSCQ
jgi:alpha-tubulin suppressor-like RCC1 family protein